MSSKVEIVTVNTPLNSSSFQQQINHNFSVIETSLNKQLQREPQEDVNNEMEQELDMNSHRIINVSEPVNNSDVATKHYVDITIKPELEANKVVVSDGNGDIVSSSITTDELNKLSGISDNIQEQIDSKQNTISDLSEIRAGAAAGATAVQSITTGTTNGTINVDGTEVSVAGLGSAAYTDTDAYATAAQGDKADSAVQSVTTGNDNGTISVDGSDVAVKGLNTAAYTSSSDYATAAQGTKADTALQNTATGTNSLTVLGTATSSNYSTNIGVSSSATSSYETVVGYNASAASSESVAIGCGTKVNSSSKGSVAVGPYAQVTGAGAIQIGYGHNQTPKSLSIGFFDSVNPVKYTLLNEFGEVPEERLTQLMISDDSDPTTATVGTVGLLYKNTTDGGIFKCTDTTGGTYVWEEIGAGTTTLSGLTDVALSTPTDGQALVYNSVTQKWENGSVAGGASYDAGTKTITL